MIEKNIKNKIKGCLVGVAAGDAMGMPTSMMSPNMIKEKFGNYITEFLPAPDGHKLHNNMIAGQVTDDTQQTLLIADSIIEKKAIDPEDIAARLIKWAESINAFNTMAVGPSSLRALYAIKEGKSVNETGAVGDTNGAVMRISAVGIYGKGDLSRTIDAVEKACLPTHNTNIAIAGASAIAMVIGTCIKGEGNIDKIIEQAIQATNEGMSRGNDWYSASIVERIKIALDIVNQNSSKEQIISDLYKVIGAGVQVSETVPTCLALLKLSNGNIIDAVQLASNLGGDCDTIASIVGSMCGAYFGADNIPSDWIDLLEKVNNYDFEKYTNDLYKTIYQN